VQALRISRPTLRKWYRRYQENGLEGLESLSRRPNQKPKRKKKHKRYQKEVPGERVQIDTCKIRPGMYQFTAVDDCTRYLVVEIYPRRTAKNTLLFLEKVCEEMPFPIQRIQTDRGTEFFAHKVQERLLERGESNSDQIDQVHPT